MLYLKIMKCVFCFLFCLLFLVVKAQDNYSIAFVHIGPKLPDYSIESIKQARLFNPTCPIYLLLEKQEIQKVEEGFKELNIEFVALETLKESSQHKYFKNTFPRKKPFWVFTTERFFYLQEFIYQYNLKNVFHLENDVMLYRDLRELLSDFCTIYDKKLAVTLDCDNRCIPGFVYISCSEPLNKLVDFFYKQKFKKDSNDMVLIANFRNTHPKYADNIPIVNPEYVLNYPLKNLQGEVARINEPYFNNFHKFQSVFDAAAIGQYLGGTHVEPGKLFINEKCYFDPSKFNYEWQLDDHSRAIPYLIFNGKKVRINNLHIHSKKLEKFAS